MTDHPLDRPAWSALNSGWSHLAQGDALARRVHIDYGPFGNAADPFSAKDLAALAALDHRGGLAIVEPQETPPPPGMELVMRESMVQMPLEELAPPPPITAEIVALAEADAPEMQALAELTRPGPFARKTHLLSQFLGVKQDGRLIAMAGERMRIPGWAEVSGVCTHPDARGRGLAAALTTRIAQRIAARGERPFLHTLASNAGAIAVYERLGFRIRRTLVLTVMKRA